MGRNLRVAVYRTLHYAQARANTPADLRRSTTRPGLTFDASDFLGLFAASGVCRR